VMRAVLMIARHVCARLGHRRYDLMSAAAAAALLLLALNPWQLFALGFQLSFLAVFSLAAGLPLFRNLPLPPPVRDLLLPVLVIQCGMAPYSAYAFHCFSPGAFFANIPVVFLAGLAVPAGVLALPLTAVLPSLSGPLGTFLDLNLTLLEAANDLFYAGGRTSLTVTAPPLPLLLAFYALLFFFTSELARIWWLRRRWKPLLQGLGLAALLVLLLTRGFGSDFRGAQAVFVDVGQGSCIHLRTPSGRQVLIDGGGRHGFNVGKKILRPYLLHSGVRRIDLALATHRDTDHYQGLLELQEQGMVDRLLTTGDGLEVGDVLLREPGFRITVVAPVAEHEEENERSLVFRVDFDDWSLLATGDIGAETEAEIAAYWRGSDLLDVDVLAVPHHGSRRSSSPALLRAASPAAAVIQVGKNIYGHPAPQTLDAYRRAGIPVFRCDRQGAAAVRPGFRWRTMLKDRSAEPK
jgi:competence protein ComEC